MKTIRIRLLLFVALLVLSGVTAFPLRTEMEFLITHKHWLPSFSVFWVEDVYKAIEHTPELVLYGTDWLAFAHIIIALFFIPVYINPVKYRINIDIGLIACLAVFPLAFICGPIRGIPFFHQLIDCCFGIGGIVFLYFIRQHILNLERSLHESA